ncbi:Hypothetical protein A7982_01751 [Minicystis rosea]|nr:Hypothetical protein A7982_01751 [Minicystis rosea]
MALPRRTDPAGPRFGGSARTRASPPPSCRRSARRHRRGCFAGAGLSWQDGLPRMLNRAPHFVT